ncbi:MAG: hypothetical protein IPF55_07755 [Rhodoferax sp.]|nr:hypothetical protein [Rhodoferax sp.]
MKGNSIMFWIFMAFAGLMAFAVTLGQISVWFALLKLALMVAVGVIVVMGIALIFRRPKQKES